MRKAKDRQHATDHAKDRAAADRSIRRYFILDYCAGVVMLGVDHTALLLTGHG
jgi:hypothetical protein